MEGNKKEYLSVRKVERISAKTGRPYQLLVVTLEDGSLEKYECDFFLNNDQKRIFANVPTVHE